MNAQTRRERADEHPFSKIWEWLLVSEVPSWMAVALMNELRERFGPWFKCPDVSPMAVYEEAERILIRLAGGRVRGEVRNLLRDVGQNV